MYENNKNNSELVAMSYFGNTITYGEMFDSIAGAEVLLKRLNISEGDTVSFVSVISPEFVYLFYACNIVGAISNLVDPRLSVTEKVERINIANTKLLVYLNACDEDINVVNDNTLTVENILIIPVSKLMSKTYKIGYAVSHLGKNTEYNEFVKSKLFFWNDEFEKINLEKKEYNHDCHKPAAIFYTGGTTGNSKGVVLSTYAINAVVEQFRRLTGGFKKGDSWLTLSVPFVAYAMICSLHAPLSYGNNANIELYDVKHIAKRIISGKINHPTATPLVYIEMLKLLERRSRNLTFLEMPIAGGDRVTAALYGKINRIFAENGCSWKICSGYGMTEVGSAVCVGYKDLANKPGSAGIPFPNTVISAFNIDTGEECKIGEEGEIRISGPGLMLEYLNQEDETDHAIKIDSLGHRWMCTGDLGFIDEDGCVYILGRLKRVIIKYDSFKVFASHVEEAAMKHENVMNSCCIGLPDTEHGCGEIPVLVICIKEKSDEEATIDAVKTICANELADYSRPNDIKIVSEMPITHAGKVDYRELIKMYS